MKMKVEESYAWKCSNGHERPYTRGAVFQYYDRKPKCPICGEEMELVSILVSEEVSERK